jgi:4,5:9,10-diseco-3-hydroxy-5,9,17-trioxoandrosta-1(10),2-diene-4-oate hydrolase
MDGESIYRSAVVGHSLGGGLALRIALEHPARVSDLVLAAPVGLRPIRFLHFARRVSPRVTDRFARWLVPRALVAMLLRGAYGEPTRVRQRDVDEYWAPSQSPDYYRAVRALLHDFDWRPLPDQLLARLSVRSLVIMGTADRLIPGAGAPAMRVEGAARLVMEGAGHLAIEERHEEVNPAIVRFLDGSRVL